MENRKKNIFINSMKLVKKQTVKLKFKKYNSIKTLKSSIIINLNYYTYKIQNYKTKFT